MADEKIKFTIGSVFTDEGFKKATTAIKDTGTKAQQAANTVKDLGSVLGATDGTVGKLAKGVQGLGGVLQSMSGGPIAVLAASVTAITAAIVSWKKAADEAAAAHKKLMAAMRDGQESRMADELAALEAREQESLDAAAKSAAQAVKHIGELSAAYRGLAAAEDAAIGVKGNLKIAQINDEFSKQFEEACDELKPLITAEKALAVATAKQETIREQQSRAIEREKVALGELDAQIEKQKAVVDAEIKAGRSGVEARDALVKLEIARSAQAQKLENAERQAEIANLEAATAVRDAQTAVTHANESWEKVVEANENEIAASELLADKKREQADLLQQQGAAIANRDMMLDWNARKTDAARKELADAQKFRTSDIEAGIRADNKTHEWMPHNFKRDSDGMLSNMKDVSRAARAYRIEQAKLEKKRAQQSDKIDNELAALDKKGQKHWNDWDKKRYQELQDQKKYLRGEKDAKDNLEKLAEERKEIEKKSEEHLKAIKEKIQELGLK